MSLSLVQARVATSDELFAELLAEIADGVVNQPRNVQARIGPSEIGEPCSRELIAKLMELPDLETGPNWQAWVGTCMHAGLQEIFEAYNARHCPDRPRFLTEQKVTVGRIGDWDLEGSCDLYDSWSESVWDWKTKSVRQMEVSRDNGISQIYRTQFHCYGLGHENAGHPVRTVGGVFMLRDGQLFQSFQLSEPYDRTIALAALERANQLYALATLLGPALAMSMYPPCGRQYCRRCKATRNGAPGAVASPLRGLRAAS